MVAKLFEFEAKYMEHKRSKIKKGFMDKQADTVSHRAVFQLVTKKGSE